MSEQVSFGGVGYLLFSGEEKRSKKVAGDYYRDCVPNPATLFGVRKKIRSISHCRDRRPRLSDRGFT